MSGAQGNPGQHFSNEQIVNWLIDECRDAGSRITVFTTSGDRILAGGSAVIAAGATVAAGGGHGHLLMWLPLGISVILVYALWINGATRALIGYKSGLEKEIERRTGVPLTAWHSRVGQHVGGINRHITGLFLMAGIVYTACAALGLMQALHTLSPGSWGHERAWFYITATAASILAGVGVSAYCYWAQREASAITERRVREIFNPDAR